MIIGKHFFTVEVRWRSEMHLPRAWRSAVSEHHLAAFEIDRDDRIWVARKLILTDVFVERIDWQLDRAHTAFVGHHAGDDQAWCGRISVAGIMEYGDVYILRWKVDLEAREAVSWSPGISCR